MLKINNGFYYAVAYAFSFFIHCYGSVSVLCKILDSFYHFTFCFLVSVGEITSGVGEGGSKNQVLFGSDLSQVDKDLIFEGLKKLYKKKVGGRGNT